MPFLFQFFLGFFEGDKRRGEIIEQREVEEREREVEVKAVAKPKSSAFFSGQKGGCMLRVHCNQDIDALQK